MEKVKFCPQFSTNRNTIKCFIEVTTTVDIAKIIKIGSLHASQQLFFGLNYQSSDKSYNLELNDFLCVTCSLW